jgi:tetratricopeptide (TPR) repeat protein
MNHLMSGLMLLVLLAGCAGRVPADQRHGADIADAALDSGLPGVALNVSRSALQADPRDLGALLRQGEALARMNQPEAAIDAWRRALAVDPAAAGALLGLGRLDKR